MYKLIIFIRLTKYVNLLHRVCFDLKELLYEILAMQLYEYIILCFGILHFSFINDI